MRDLFKLAAVRIAMRSIARRNGTTQRRTITGSASLGSSSSRCQRSRPRLC
jgi:hypothetical protein